MLMRLLATLLLIFALSGCASLIGQSALHPPMLKLDPIPAQAYAQIGYEQARYCVEGRDDSCLAYRYASAYDNQGRALWAEAAEEWQASAPIVSTSMEVALRVWPAPEKTLADRRRRQAMRYRVELETTRGTDHVELFLDGTVSAQPRGTYILVHGFRTNKESLFFVAESMRFAGFNVLMVDMYGHGQSEGRFTFTGKPEAQAIGELIDTLDLRGPIHVAGMSMGGTAVTHLAALRDDVQSVLLLAPMLKFVDAFVDAGRAYTRSAHLLPRSSLQKGARYALAEAGAQEHETAIVQRVAELERPVLIFASSEDKISPLGRLQRIAERSERTTLHVVQPRTHHGMILWDTEDYGRWREWLEGI